MVRQNGAFSNVRRAQAGARVSDSPAVPPPGNEDGGCAAMRASLAAQLYRQGWAPRALISLGDPGREFSGLREFGVCALDERETTEQVLKRCAVPPSDIEILDGVNSTTRLEAENALSQARRRGWKSLVVATCNCHTRRSRLLFRRLFRGSGIQVHVAAVPPEREFNPDGRWRRRLDMKTIFWEYQKLIFFTLSFTGDCSHNLNSKAEACMEVSGSYRSASGRFPCRRAFLLLQNARRVSVVSMLMIAASVEIFEFPANARLPVNNSYRTEPNEKMSPRVSPILPSACSGDM